MKQRTSLMPENQQAEQGGLNVGRFLYTEHLCYKQNSVNHNFVSIYPLVQCLTYRYC